MGTSRGVSQRAPTRKRAERVAAALKDCDWSTPELEEIVAHWFDKATPDPVTDET